MQSIYSLFNVNTKSEAKHFTLDKLSGISFCRQISKPRFDYFEIFELIKFDFRQTGNLIRDDITYLFPFLRRPSFQRECYLSVSDPILMVYFQRPASGHY